MEPKGSSFTTARHLSLSWLIHIIPPYLFSKIYFNIILPSNASLASGLLSSGFPTNTLYARLPHMCYMPCPSHSSWFDHLNNIWWGVQNIKLLVMYSSPLPCYLVPPEHPVLNLCSSLNVSDQVSHPCKIAGKTFSSVYFSLYIFGQ